MANEDYFEIDAGDLSLWIEQSESLCIKAITSHGDPVELSVDEAQKLADQLLIFIEKINGPACA